MITPTTAYNRMPAAAPEAAAAMVVRALEQRPPRIDTPLGTLGQLGEFLTPGWKRLLLHQEYRLFPDSPAARATVASSASPPGVPGTRPSPTLRSRTARMVKRTAGHLPGIYW